MNVQYSLKNMAAWEERRLKEYVEDKMPSLVKLISHFQDDELLLTVRGERFDKNNAYRAELVLEMPSKTCIGVEDSHSIEKAVDLAKDRLLKQFKRHEEQLKNKGKSNSLLKRNLKEFSEDRTHRPIEEFDDQAFENIESSITDSKPISTF